MGVVRGDRGAVEGMGDARGSLLHRRGGGGAERELGLAALARAIDGEARAVRPAVGQRGEHAGGEPAKLGFERRVFDEESDDAAHVVKCSG